MHCTIRYFNIHGVQYHNMIFNQCIDYWHDDSDTYVLQIPKSLACTGIAWSPNTYWYVNSRINPITMVANICDCPCKNQPSLHQNLNSFLSQLIATLISYLHSMSYMTRLNWSAFLGVAFNNLVTQ